MDVLIGGQRGTLTTQIGDGGEGEVYEHPWEPDQYVKIVHAPTSEFAERIAAMVNNPLRLPMNAPFRVAWPIEEVCRVDGTLCGFTMNAEQEAMDLDQVMAADTAISIPFLVRIALNFTWMVDELIGTNCIPVDVHPQNVLVNRDGSVVAIDVDSFQVELQGRNFRSAAAIDRFLAAELHGLDLHTINRKPAHVHFGVAVVLFMLFSRRTHPFACQWKGPGRSPGAVGCIRAGKWPYSPKYNDVAPPRNAPPFAALPSNIQNLFQLAFEVGHGDPMARPTMADWCVALRSLDIGCDVTIDHATWEDLRSGKSSPPRNQRAQTVRAKPQRHRPKRVLSHAAAASLLAVGLGGSILAYKVVGAARAAVPIDEAYSYVRNMPRGSVSMPDLPLVDALPRSTEPSHPKGPPDDPLLWDLLRDRDTQEQEGEFI